MKNLLSILGAVSLTAIGANSVVACGCSVNVPINNEIKPVEGWDENNGRVIAITNDKDNNIYIGSFINTNKHKGKLFKLSANEKKIEPVEGWDENYGVGALFTDKDNNIYIGAFTYYDTNKIKGKLFKLSANEKKIEPVEGWDENNRAVTAITSDKDNNIYIGAWKYDENNKEKGKLFKLSANEKKIEPVENWDENNGAICKLTSDEDNNIYIGTWKYDENKKFISKLFKLSADEKKVEPVEGWNTENYYIRNLFTDKDNNIYIATENKNQTKGKLFKLSADEKKVEPVEGWDENNSLVWDLTSDKDNNIYIGAWKYDENNKEKGKLFKLSANEKKIEPVESWNEDNGAIRNLFTDKNENIYIGTRLNSDTNKEKGKLFKLSANE